MHVTNLYPKSGSTSFKIRISQGIHSFLLLFNIIVDFLATEMKQEKEILKNTNKKGIIYLFTYYY
jgi:hypothetical protein